jgi:hypothetical protein
MATIKVPYKFIPRDYQLPLLQAFDSGLINRGVLVWHRRSGKDLTVSAGIVVKKMMQRVGTYFYIFPTYNQGRKILWDGIDRDGVKFMDHFPSELISKKNEAEMRIEFKNGSAFQIVGCDNIDNVVGTNPVGVVFSEYPLGRSQAWDYIRPILAENGGWSLFVYTPRGMNHGWKILQQAKVEPGWFWQILTVDDTHAISQEVLDSERRQMPEDLYYQEYYCKFIDGAGQFFRNIDRCIYDDKFETEPSKKFQITPGRRFRLGVDLGKYQDFTVITPLDLTTFKIGTPERFNQMDYSLQKARIETEYFKYNKGLIRIDSTGVGEPVYDDLASKSLNIEPFTFTQTSRTNLLNNLRLLLENETIKIPNNQLLLDELRSFQYELADLGRVKITVPDGLHDDMVMSLALAVWDLPVLPLVNKPQQDKELIKQFDSHQQREKTKYFTGSRYLRR